MFPGKGRKTENHDLICVKKKGGADHSAPPPCDPKLFYFHHPVADPDVRLNELRRIRIGFQLFAQRHHKDPERGYIIVPAPAPDMLRDKGMRQVNSIGVSFISSPFRDAHPAA